MIASTSVDETNHLAGESSPYLLQHSKNPVHWYPWGEAAFEKARKEDKPVFLSIGYATCHWCHVMEKESFEDIGVASLMNDTFVSIKVDREERPDIDHIYMAICQLMTGSGGWPLTVIMTPDKRPFFSATYIPKTARFGRQGMMTLIPAVATAWRHKRDQISLSSDKITSALTELKTSSSKNRPTEADLSRAFYQLSSRFDAENGGFGTGMKFPSPHQLNFLLRYFHRYGNPDALEMVTKTLDAMRHGGIYDHVGFGFHRYATDPAWRVPHFEKMLYDQALLLNAYTEAYQAAGAPLHRQTALEIAEYVLRDMTSPSGGFYSAEDADSEGVEGKFYLWSKQEIALYLDASDSELFEDLFELREEGNFDGHDDETAHTNTLYMKAGFHDAASRRGLSPERLHQIFDSARRRLFQARKSRIPPFKDDKILADWNGLMMGALARSGRILDAGDLIDAARKNAAFIETYLMDDDGRLLHRYRNGVSGLPAHLDDYAFVVSGLIDLFEATQEPSHLKEAIRLNTLMLELFKDSKGGALFITAEDTETILVRSKELYDGALPSGNSVAVLNLLKLAKITGDFSLENAADELMGGFGDEVQREPMNNTMFLLGLDFALGPSVEVVVSGRRDQKDTSAMLRSIDTVYSPRCVTLLRDADAPQEISELAPFVENHPMHDNKATAYVCVNRACSLPETDPDKAARLIRVMCGLRERL